VLMEMTGTPASFRQLDDDNKEMLGQADKLDYYDPKSLLVLTGNACFSNDGDLIESSMISINTENDNLEAASPEPDKRVRVVIQPKDKVKIEPAGHRIDCK
jgi:lipopolysaccharide transport protein LptA